MKKLHLLKKRVNKMLENLIEETDDEINNEIFKVYDFNKEEINFINQSLLVQ